MEGVSITYNGWMNDEADRIGGDGEIESLMKKKALTNFISTWKQVLNFLPETERNED